MSQTTETLAEKQRYILHEMAVSQGEILASRLLHQARTAKGWTTNDLAAEYNRFKKENTGRRSKLSGKDITNLELTAIQLFELMALCGQGLVAVTVKPLDRDYAAFCESQLNPALAGAFHKIFVDPIEDGGSSEQRAARRGLKVVEKAAPIPEGPAPGKSS